MFGYSWWKIWWKIWTCTYSDTDGVQYLKSLGTHSWFWNVKTGEGAHKVIWWKQFVASWRDPGVECWRLTQVTENNHKKKIKLCDSWSWDHVSLRWPQMSPNWGTFIFWARWCLCWEDGARCRDAHFRVVSKTQFPVGGQYNFHVSRKETLRPNLKSGLWLSHFWIWRHYPKWEVTPVFHFPKTGAPTSFISSLPSFLMFPLHNQSGTVFPVRSWDACRICWKPQADGEVVWSPLPPSGKPAANIPPWPWNLEWLLGDLPSVASWGEIKDLETAQACQRLGSVLGASAVICSCKPSLYIFFQKLYTAHSCSSMAEKLIVILHLFCRQLYLWMSFWNSICLGLMKWINLN